ncbi:uncharacterized protein J3D65DRAFT_177853 [Phyllosticta citribraziliensis]|uniref:Uncharacterized protein n=1 Tax=Phyllosticta citribraziliensis TaxID=989973 RepID=A0ABR1L3H9_9PEZI
MASDQWNGFHHAPHPDEDDDWYYDEPEYLADQPPPPPPPQQPQQPQQSAMLHYQPYAQPAPQPKVRVDLSRVSYSTWQNPWQSSLRYQNQQSARPAYGYSAWDYQEEEEEQDEEYASSGMEYVDEDSFHANPHFLDQDEPESGPSEASHPLSLQPANFLQASPSHPLQAVARASTFQKDSRIPRARQLEMAKKF